MSMLGLLHTAARLSKTLRHVVSLYYVFWGVIPHIHIWCVRKIPIIFLKLETKNKIFQRLPMPLTKYLEVSTLKKVVISEVFLLSWSLKCDLLKSCCNCNIHIIACNLNNFQKKIINIHLFKFSFSENMRQNTIREANFYIYIYIHI